MTPKSALMQSPARIATTTMDSRGRDHTARSLRWRPATAGWALYRLLAWLSPAFPIGAFSYSHGLEAAVEGGAVRDRASLQSWIAAIVTEGSGRIDADILRDAHRAASAGDLPVLTAVNQRGLAYRATAELALESRAQGEAFLATCRSAWPDPFLDQWAAIDQRACYAAAVGAATARAGILLEDVLLAYLQAMAANLVSAGLRLAIIGQTDGQRILAALEPVVIRCGAGRNHPRSGRFWRRNFCCRSRLDGARNPVYETVSLMNASAKSDPLRVGIGGPVGSGKTALMDWLCKTMRGRFEIAAITNDIYTREDAEFLTRSGALPPERIRGVETGGCPHTAIREDASINLAAVAEMTRLFPRLDLILIESGGDNLAATFSPELADLTIYVIDVAAGDKIPRKGGPGITRSDLLVINKTDLAPLVGASLDIMDRDAKRMRGARPFVFTNLKSGTGVDEIVDFVITKGGALRRITAMCWSLSPCRECAARNSRRTGRHPRDCGEI